MTAKNYNLKENKKNSERHDRELETLYKISHILSVVKNQKQSLAEVALEVNMSILFMYLCINEVMKSYEYTTSFSYAIFVSFNISWIYSDNSYNPNK